MAQRDELLEPLLGYDEIEKACSISRSSVERAWRGPWKEDEPRLPKPGKIRGRALWLLSVVEAWRAACMQHEKGELRAFAITDTDKLEPDQVEDAMLELGSRRMTQLVGRPVSPADIEMNHWCDKSDSDTRLRLMSRLRDLCNDFDLGRAQYVAAAVFDSVRRELAKREVGEVYCNPELLRKIASAALNDDDWQEMLDECFVNRETVLALDGEK